jgi:murein DD-endopeptidase MepM/ murein hydrolase activator NlpD
MCNCASAPVTGESSPSTDTPQVNTEARQIEPGENVDCYINSNTISDKDVLGPPPPGKIANTALVSSLDLWVDTEFDLTPNSPVPALRWKIAFDGVEGVPSGMGLNFNPATGLLKGQVGKNFANKQYKVLVTATAANDSVIDSREYTFFPKTGQRDETVKFVWPFFPSPPRSIVNSKFGPRVDPVSGQGAAKPHGGVDIKISGRAPGELGYILAAGDGVVIDINLNSQGYGHKMVIEHKDSSGKLVALTLYGHWTDHYVKVGQQVAAGQRIAREGSTGRSTGPHLHFEVHKGKLGNKVDPLGYINADNVSVVGSTNVAGEAVPGTTETKNFQNQGMTSKEAKAAQSDKCKPAPSSTAPSPTSETPALPVTPANADVQKTIQQALDEDGSLTDEDKKIIMFMAKIESTFNPKAKNKNSSALGLFQMLDKTATHYYGTIGIPGSPTPPYEKRVDPYLATKAQIQFYKREMLRYWNEFQSSGQTRLANKTLSENAKARLAPLNKGEFVYGIVHHDGVGSGVAGKDLGGVAYWRKRIGSA